MNLFFEPKESEIPESLYNDEGNLFSNCLVCNKELLDSSSEYMIEKAYKKYPGQTKPFVVFEYAICFECAENMRNELSKETVERMDKFFNERANLSDRISRLVNGEEPDFNLWTKECVITGESIEECEEHQLITFCKGNKLRFHAAPFMISGQAMEEMAELMSEKSKDELDDFIDEFFGLPPEWKEAIKDRDFVFV